MLYMTINQLSEVSDGDKTQTGTVWFYIPRT